MLKMKKVNNKSLNYKIVTKCKRKKVEQIDTEVIQCKK